VKAEGIPSPAPSKEYARYILKTYHEDPEHVLPQIAASEELQKNLAFLIVTAGMTSEEGSKAAPVLLKAVGYARFAKLCEQAG